MNCSPKEVQDELGRFIRGTSGSQKMSHSELSRCALSLLHTLPVSHSAVLQYLCNLFDEAANGNLFPTESGFSGLEGGSTNLDDVIDETSDVILDIITQNPGPWAPIISSWSFDLLGHISVKYSARIRMPQGSTLNQELQVWMTCIATKRLIHIAMECFAAMVRANPDICVDSLLEASVKYTPYFDWVVAHIGSCFPTTIITRVLMSGLKDFCIHGNSTVMDMGATSDDKASKMVSVVGILGHLASKHGQDIRKALIDLFKESMEPEEDHMKMSTVTFLLQMASMSPLLLHIITTDFLTILTPEVLNTLHDQFYRWSSDNSDFFSLLSLVVHLVMKTDVGAYRVFNFLLDVAAPEGDKVGECKEAVKSIAVTLLDQLCVDLQRASYNRRRDALEIPFLSSLSKHSQDITKTLMLAEERRGEWMGEILTYTALYSGEVSAADILSHILTHASTTQQLRHFMSLQTQLEAGFPLVFRLCITRFIDTLLSLPSPTHYQSLVNLLAVVMAMKAREADDPKEKRTQFSQDFRQHLPHLASLLTHSDLRVAIATARVIHAVGLDERCQSDVVLDLCNAVCLFLFTIFTVTDYRLAGTAFTWCRKCVTELCQYSIARNILLRLLMDMAFYTEFCATLGGQHKPTTTTTVNSDQWLLRENRTHSLSLTLPQSHSTVFHAGVIGDGRRGVATNTLNISQGIVLRNRTHFVDVLLLCTTLERPHNLGKPTPDPPTDVIDPRIDPFFYTNESGRKLAELMVDMLTPDVLYNSILWPEEECIPLTIERDLHVSRQFEQHPVLWDILDLYSNNQAFVCYLSPVLRSLMATVINHFDSSRHIKPLNTDTYESRGRRIIDSFRQGKQLPSPLCHIGEILPLVSQYEVSLLLTNIWKYIKENPPKIDNSRKRSAFDPRYKAVIQSVLHSNIATLGQYYSQFFPQPS